MTVFVVTSGVSEDEVLGEREGRGGVDRGSESDLDEGPDVVGVALVGRSLGEVFDVGGSD